MFEYGVREHTSSFLAPTGVDVREEVIQSGAWEMLRVARSVSLGYTTHVAWTPQEWRGSGFDELTTDFFDGLPWVTACRRDLAVGFTVGRPSARPEIRGVFVEHWGPDDLHPGFFAYTVDGDVGTWTWKLQRGGEQFRVRVRSSRGQASASVDRRLLPSRDGFIVKTGSLRPAVVKFVLHPGGGLWWGHAQGLEADTQSGPPSIAGLDSVFKLDGPAWGPTYRVGPFHATVQELFGLATVALPLPASGSTALPDIRLPRLPGVGRY